MAGNIFASILENLGKNMTGFGTAAIQHQNDVDLEKEKTYNTLNYYSMATTGKPFPRESIFSSEKSKAQSPSVGDIVDGYQFLGGDPSNPKSWGKAK